MFTQIALLCLVSLAAAQYRPQYEAPSYPKPYEPSYEAKPEPYSFGYDVKDEYGATQNRKEEGDEYGNKRGSYGYTDGYGIYRQVDYVADDKGFRAVIKTNEPGTDNQNPADIQIHSEAAPVKYEGSSSYGSANAYSRPTPSGAYSRPAPSYRPAPTYQPSQPQVYSAPASYQPSQHQVHSAPASYEPSPAQVYSAPASYQQVAPRPYQPAPEPAKYQPVAATPEQAKYQPASGNNYSPY